MICTGYTLQSTRIRFSKCRVPVADTPTFILCTYTVCGINSNKIADHFKVTTAAAELVSVEFRSAHKKLLLQFLIFHLPPPFNKNHHFTMSTPSNQTPPPYTEKGEKVEQSWKGGDSASYRCRQRYQRWHTQYGSPKYMELYNKNPEVYGRFAKDTFRNHLKDVIKDYASALALKKGAGKLNYC